MTYGRRYGFCFSRTTMVCPFARLCDSTHQGLPFRVGVIRFLSGVKALGLPRYRCQRIGEIRPVTSRTCEWRPKIKPIRFDIRSELIACVTIIWTIHNPHQTAHWLTFACAKYCSESAACGAVFGSHCLDRYRCNQYRAAKAHFFGNPG